MNRVNYEPSIDFYFNENFNTMYGFFREDSPEDTKAFYVSDSINIYINLNAYQWKGLSEQQLIEELTKTITHEILHFVFNLEKIECDLEVEENICVEMSGQ